MQALSTPGIADELQVPEIHASPGNGDIHIDGSRMEQHSPAWNRRGLDNPHLVPHVVELQGFRQPLAGPIRRIELQHLCDGRPRQRPKIPGKHPRRRERFPRARRYRNDGIPRDPESSRPKDVRDCLGNGHGKAAVGLELRYQPAGGPFLGAVRDIQAGGRGPCEPVRRVMDFAGFSSERSLSRRLHLQHTPQLPKLSFSGIGQ